MEKPQIVTNLKPLSRIVDETKCGIVVPSGNSRSFANAIIHLANNKNLCFQYGKNGLQAAKEKYNWHIESYKLIDMYKNLSKKEGI